MERKFFLPVRSLYRVFGAFTTLQEIQKSARSQEKTRFVALKDLFLSPEIHIKGPILLPSSDLKTEFWKFSNESIHYESGNLDEVARRLEFSDADTTIESIANFEDSPRFKSKLKAESSMKKKSKLHRNGEFIDA
ncbi:uncharacterized protein LOC116738684 [Nasonia vitripennis]|uniref:Uncharacterized protein n=1 Tax=Nasonia vitripennis TaxID=7425 RepID=A0A7M7R5U7_NASVI|nr:uncharacterized protein LOC116738684 [Nasonia vitripennis]